MAEESIPPPKRKRTAAAIPKTALEAQKIHLEKLMSDPNKAVVIPDMDRTDQYPEPPEFMRFYMGSSAGAGSEVFHIYRHLRRKETLRQNHIKGQAEQEEKEETFQEALASNRSKSAEVTAKKRAKRLKKKQNRKEGIKEKGGSPSDVRPDVECHQEVQTELNQESVEEVNQESEQEVNQEFVQEVNQESVQEVNQESVQEVNQESVQQTNSQSADDHVDHQT